MVRAAVITHDRRLEADEISVTGMIQIWVTCLAPVFTTRCWSKLNCDHTVNVQKKILHLRPISPSSQQSALCVHRILRGTLLAPVGIWFSIEFPWFSMVHPPSLTLNDRRLAPKRKSKGE